MQQYVFANLSPRNGPLRTEVYSGLPERPEIVRLMFLQAIFFWYEEIYILLAWKSQTESVDT